MFTPDVASLSAADLESDVRLHQQDCNQCPGAEHVRAAAAEYVKPYWSHAPAISLNYWTNQIEGKERIRLLD